MNPKAEELIKKYEGYRDKAYQCSAGVWTIGWGHTRGVKKGDTCTLEQAQRWFIEDYDEAVQGIKEVVQVDLNENQLGALTSFVFNLGIGNLKRSTLLRELNFHRYDQAAGEFRKWSYANGIWMRGLFKRRMEEAELFLTPCT